MSLKSSYTGIQILIKVPYIRFQLIYRSAGSNKSSVTAMFYALKVTNATIITFLLTRSGGISWNLLLRPFKPLVEGITLLRRK